MQADQPAASKESNQPVFLVRGEPAVLRMGHHSIVAGKVFCLDSINRISLLQTLCWIPKGLIVDFNERIKRYREAGVRAVDYTIKFQLPDGGYIWDGYVPDAYHKQGYSWHLVGRFDEGHRLMDWAMRNTLQPDGHLKDYKGDVYKQTWFGVSAHRLGRFDLSYAVMSHLLSYQAPCGGFPRFSDQNFVRGVSTSWMGIAALNFGNLDVAKKAAECCNSMLDQQPDENRFYCLMNPDGQLITEKDDPQALFIDVVKPKQIYYELGIPMLLLCKLHQITGNANYLAYAKKFFDFHLGCHEDNFACVSSGKGALAAAIYYLITDDERGRDAAYRFCDFLLETQLPDGSWIDRIKDPDELLYYVDHAACFNIWLQEIATTLESKEAMAATK